MADALCSRQSPVLCRHASAFAERPAAPQAPLDDRRRVSSLADRLRHTDASFVDPLCLYSPLSTRAGDRYAWYFRFIHWAS